MRSYERALREWEAEEHRFLELAAELEREAESMPSESRLHVAANLETARRVIRDSKERIAAVAKVVDDA